MRTFQQGDSRTSNFKLYSYPSLVKTEIFWTTDNYIEVDCQFDNVGIHRVKKKFSSCLVMFD